MPLALWGFADQALISATGFVMMILLARQLGPQAFGAFVLAQTVLIFSNSLQSPLFIQPHNVLGAARTGDDYARYTTSTALAQLALSVCAGLVVAGVAVVFLVTGRDHGPLMLAVALATVTWQLQEFLRRVFYTQGDYFAAFTNDLVSYGGQLTGITLLWRLDRLTAATAIIAIAIASATGGMVGAWRLRTVLFHYTDWQRIRNVMSENWMFGRWLLGSALTSWISGQLYPLLTAGFVGVAATGGLRAAQTLLGPTHILLRGMEAMLPSRAARIYDSAGTVSLRQYMQGVAIRGGIAMVLYCGLVALFAEPLLTTLLSSEYQPYAWLIRFVALAYFLGFLSTLASIILRSVGNNTPLFVAYACSSVIVLTVGVWAVSTYGLAGAIAGLVGHLVIVNSVLWWQVSRTLKV